MRRELVVVSNRGPLSFTRDDQGGLVTTKAAGGLVNAVRPALVGREQPTTWVAAAISEADRAAMADGVPAADGVGLRLVDIPEDEYAAHYDRICNETLWYLHHGLFDLARQPVFDRGWWDAWGAYRSVNRRFADVVCDVAPPDAVVLVHDHHLALVAAAARKRRPDLGWVHFSHTPFADVTALPEAVAPELLAGMAAHDACGFHDERWRAAFVRACSATDHLVTAPRRTFVSPAAPDLDDLLAVSRSSECAEAYAALDEAVGGRAVIARVDRIELSKNLLRGFLAFDELLTTQPEWRGRVVFAASVYPSRENVADYALYREEVLGVVGRVNGSWGTAEWTPILMSPRDHFPTAAAHLRRADVLLVNPVRDGLNLVAKEGPMVNERDAVVVLSTECGAASELRDGPLLIHPLDVSATARALHTALSMPPAERAARAAQVRDVVGRRTPADWLADLIAAAEP